MMIFAPIGPQPPDEVGNIYFPDGSTDYFDLFDEGSPWNEARSRLGAFKIHAWQARVFFSDEEMITMIDYLNRHGIPLIMEAEPLNPPTTCRHTESFEGPNELQTARKIKRLGGTIAAVAIEQPYSFGHKLDGEGACRYSVERVVDEVVTWVGEMREIFPDVRVGSIEGVWQSPKTTPDDMATWLDAYETASGEPFAFLHMDVDWYGSDWTEVLRGIEEVAGARGVPFGVIYNGGLETDSDAWIQQAITWAAEFEEAAGGTPDHIVFQSWTDKPDHVLPENALSGFTHVINRYYGTRTHLTEPTYDSSAEAIVGTADSSDDTAVPGVTVEASAAPLDGAVQTAVLEGTVPDGATEALVVVRVNAEEAASGALDAALYEIAYSEGDSGNLVPNGDFSQQDLYWGVGDTSADVRFGPSDRNGEPALMMSADVGEPIIVNGELFTTTPGAPYRFEVELGVVALLGVARSGTVSVAFLPPSGEVRHTIQIDAQDVELGSAVADDMGRYVIPIGSTPSGTYRVTVETPGDLTTWPARAVVPLALG